MENTHTHTQLQNHLSCIKKGEENTSICSIRDLPAEATCHPPALALTCPHSLIHQSSTTDANFHVFQFVNENSHPDTFSHEPSGTAKMRGDVYVPPPHHRRRVLLTHRVPKDL